MSLSNYVRVPQPLKPIRLRVHALQLEKLSLWESPALQPRVALVASTRQSLHADPVCNEDPVQPEKHRPKHESSCYKACRRTRKKIFATKGRQELFFEMCIRNLISNQRNSKNSETSWKMGKFRYRNFIKLIRRQIIYWETAMYQVLFFFLAALYSWWDLWFPDQGSNLGLWQRECRVLTTGPPGNSQITHQVLAGCSFHWWHHPSLTAALGRVTSALPSRQTRKRKLPASGDLPIGISLWSSG